MPLIIPPTMALRLAGFFGSKIVKLVIVILALALLGFVVYKTVDAVRDWQVDTYNKGFTSGSDMQEARWQKIAAQNALLQRDQLVQDVKAQNVSVLDYLRDISSRKPQTDRIEKEIVRYAQSPAGSVQCLDDAGVRLVLDGRQALGLTGPTGPASGAPGPVQPTMRTVPAPVRVLDSSGRAVLHDEGAGGPQPVEQ